MHILYVSFWLGYTHGHRVLIISSAFNKETVSSALDTIHLEPLFGQNNNEQYTKAWHWRMFWQTAAVHSGSSFNSGPLSNSEALYLLLGMRLSLPANFRFTELFWTLRLNIMFLGILAAKLFIWSCFCSVLFFIECFKIVPLMSCEQHSTDFVKQNFNTEDGFTTLQAG